MPEGQTLAVMKGKETGQADNIFRTGEKPVNGG
jgi:hypothetical protein